MPPLRTFPPLGLFVQEDFLSVEERRDIARHMIGAPRDPAAVFGDTPQGRIDAEVRRAWEVAPPVDHAASIESRLRALRPVLERYFDAVLREPDEPGYVVYPPGAFYRAHRDQLPAPDPSGAHRRAVSVVIFVNGLAEEPRFTGGRLRFYGLLGGGPLEEIGLDADPQGGALIAFRSSIQHEVTEVEDGVRCSIVSWFIAAS